MLILALAVALDAAFFCVLMGTGHSLLTSHLIAVGSSAGFFWLGELRKSGSAPVGLNAFIAAAAAFAAASMQGAILAAFVMKLGWRPQLAILPAAVAAYIVMHVARRHSPADFARMPWGGMTFGILIYSFLLRIVYCGPVELLPEEAYYWNYSRHLDYGYLDHPPMVAWLIKVSTMLCGNGESGIRAGALACGALTAFFVVRLTRNLFGEASSAAALMLVCTLPYFFLSGFIMTPDAPLVAAWAGCLYFLERALLGHKTAAWRSAGAMLGVGLISKYSIGLLFPVTAAWMCVDGPSRRWWRRPEPYLAGAIALGVFSPVIVWNARHHWASFAFQTSRRLADHPQFALHKLLLSALLLITPLGVAALVAALRIRTLDAAAQRFTAYVVLLPVGVFACFSLRHEVKLDWTGAPWVGALPLLGCGLFAAHWTRSLWPRTWIVLLLMYGAGLHYLALGLPGIGYSKNLELSPVGWREFSRIIMDAAEAAAEAGAKPLIVGMDRYAIASELAFYGELQTGVPVPTASAGLFDGIGLMYDRWMPPASLEHRTLLLVAESAQELDTPLIAAHVARLAPIESAWLRKDGVPVRQIYHRLAFDYRSRGAPVANPLN